ncbi:ABC-three component system protein [Paenibacillus polymyxa]|uniref:ABC-three component system protein n=1 Tax=Paenibacillus polymyxa TaxID=1406 RepID=UPI000471FD12|nr:ABC-three component system protein [Paenibacillus polymyxa]
MTKDHSAAGQALGYVYQFDRATYRLFQAGIDVIEIGIEDIDDVSVHLGSGKEIREQDKSTVNSGSPLSDRSVALWKTLHIWAELLNSDPSVLDYTEFHLVTNGSVHDDCLAQRIHKATDEDSSKLVCDEMYEILPTLRKDLSPFGQSIGKMVPELLRSLIIKVSVFDKVSPRFGGDIKDIPALRFYDDGIKISLFDQINGWIKRRIRQAVENDLPPRILRKDFDRELQALIRRVTVARLSAIIEPFTSDIEFNDFQFHGFVQQLDWINLDEETIREAIIHYSHAQDTRMKWTDNSLVSEATLSLYEKDLTDRWKIAHRRALRQPFSEDLQGQECLDATLSEDTYIDNEIMPKPITCGNFHALAHFTDEHEPQIGWHPQFKKLSKGTE